MSDIPNRSIGAVSRVDLTVPDAERVRDFYNAVVGWESSHLDMGGCADFNVIEPDTGRVVAGICHARGPNAALPAQWMISITVRDLDRSIAECKVRGGEVVTAIRGEPGQDRFCVIRDPAGAVAALYEVASEG